MNARSAAVEELERRIGHTFADRDLLERALTHASVGEGGRKFKTNERLEFLGDRVLNLVVAEALFQQMPEADEGVLSRAFHQLINYESCAVVARLIGLDQAIRLGGGAAKLGLRKNDRVLGDACEALIAALYIDGGMDVAQAFILKLWSDPLGGVEVLTNDAKSKLQQWALARGLPTPEYVTIGRVGAEHKPTFTIEVRLPDLEPASATGSSKREAERLAAHIMLTRQTGAL